ncbi:hypothetical protein pEaSNUABM22_00065 [Erwinia phage pEa_SNUABM_22]|uniref:Uncharacterized protein n=1 Tax=Erwinia phage pEa_SNUABM_22 TaxID=2869549 RepID=A0AAE8XUK9_9CAUD|nr:hypothetical protein MPK63_gp065 [Erwinia phage pEa_SNUABM_22]UAW96553.1 hypothetical protein pEaSNUABM22_00065 [Erwinia phage pEa_SNUABM_22]
MSYTMIVQHNIKLKTNTPKKVINKIRAWHREPWAFDYLNRHFKIDVYRALGPGCGRCFNLRAKQIFNVGSGVVPHIRTTALFSRGKDGVEALQQFFDCLAEYIANTDEVIAVIRGEDGLFDQNEGMTNMFEDVPKAYGYYAVRIVNDHAKIEWTVDDIYEQLPWVTYAY